MTTSTTVHIGADVMGTDGKLGELSRMIAEARTGTITDLVVKHGTILSHERIVPIAHVTNVADGVIHLDMDSKMLETMDGFTEELRGPNPDYVGPPPMDRQGPYQGDMVFEAMYAAGAYAFAAGKPMGYPGGEALTPDFVARPAIDKGTPVFASDGEKVGEVGDFAVDPETGDVTRLAVQKGFIFHHDVELPADWIAKLGDDGVLLNVSKSEVESHVSAEESNS